jgi:hypothetical protein
MMLIVYILNYFQKVNTFVRELIQLMVDELIQSIKYVYNLVHKSIGEKENILNFRLINYGLKYSITMIGKI